MKKSTNTRRKVTLVILLVLVPILLFLGWSQASFNLSFMRPANAPETLVLNALSALIVVAFVIFALILARILLKLYVEKRQRRLGAQFKTKMVVAFLGLSLLPVGFLFVFSYGLLNRTMDKWFGIPFDTVRRDAGEIVQELRRQSEQPVAGDVPDLVICLTFDIDRLVVLDVGVGPLHANAERLLAKPAQNLLRAVHRVQQTAALLACERQRVLLQRAAAIAHAIEIGERVFRNGLLLVELLVVQFCDTRFNRAIRAAEPDKHHNTAQAEGKERVSQ